MGKNRGNPPTRSAAIQRQQAVVAALEREMLISETFSREISTAVEEKLAGKWDPDCAQPTVSVVELQLKRAELQLALKGVVSVKCGRAMIPFRLTVRADINWNDAWTKEEVARQVSLVLTPLQQQFIEELQARLPQNAEDFYDRFTVVSHPELDAMAREITRRPDVQAMLAQRTAALQASYRERLEKEPHPAGFHPADVVSLQYHCYTHGSTGMCILQVHLESGLFFDQKAEYALGNCAFYTNAERQRQYLETHIMECLQELLQSADDIPAVYIASSLQEIPGMTDSLKTLLQQGTVSLGHIKVKWRGLHYDGEPLLYLPMEDDGMVRRSMGEAYLVQCPVLPLCPAVLEQPALSLEQYAEPPRELAGFCRLGAALETAVQQMFQQMETPAPQMVLLRNRLSQPYLTCGSRSVVLKERETAAGQKLLRFLHQMAELEIVRPLDRQRQLEVLNTLNPTELTILRYISANGEIWYTALARAIEDQVCTTKVYTGECLRRLTEIKVPANGEERPLLWSQLTYSRKHEDFLMYSMGVRIEKEVLDAAVARPFGPADVEHMKPAERGKWFTQYLLEAGEDQRWTRFNEALEHMPNTFLAAFAKSEAGQAFLQSFDGADAMFVRFTVEALPGCKRLAAQLWPEEAPKESGETQKTV